MTEIENTSFTSFYVTAQFYENVLADVKKLESDFSFLPIERKEEAERILFKEARLLDELRLEEWLSLYSRKCLYWVPATPGGGDPRKEVSLAFDDRRRLEDRVYRIRTGYAYSQLPLSRTRRMITNIEAAEGSSEQELLVRSNFCIHEFRVGELRSFAGWTGYKLQKEDEGWKISLKMVNLIDADQAHKNLTFML
ncbi:benzoate/toluate 1,2-dioxygenase beta subunit [Alteribacillus persepolensis]|uniref:Benzoate/toluate 1,2-dioxygenase beta subunit n=1 Tax=Alteribacillus persepolensis TaxID=568899 RepID=A0A1G8J4H2_9BACI|nr:aromatic-ring-hydroxylating dioxygenase subunit beta [Alteribacillus persepolensis]SDI25953.1 benzoate/toluate 1,2-dioxygenase beta subunit [Alteribacillus persepolensis]